MVFEKPNGNLAIYDWKRCKSIDYENDYGKMAKTKCIEHLPDAKFWHYSLQLNMYKTLLSTLCFYLLSNCKLTRSIL